MEGAKRFLGKTVRIKTNKNFFYSGKVLEVTNSSLILDDKKEGEMFISIDSIDEIKNLRGDY